MKKWNQKVNLIGIGILLWLNAFGQINSYQYKMDLQGIETSWHKIELPDQIFGKVTPNFSDLRIFGVSNNQDTITAPYLMRFNKEQLVQKEVTFKLINQVRNEKGAYFTFEMPRENTVNQILLDFKKPNFDWKIVLEGSQNQNEWFTLTADYRILSIKNNSTNYKFTEVSFPPSKYRFLRILVPDEKNPEFLKATIFQADKTAGKYRDYPLEITYIEHDKDTKRTTVDLELGRPLPISFLKVDITATYDYYRPISISYVTDSVNTEKGWRYNYRNLASGTLTSIEENTFKFTSTILQKLRIVIVNQDNDPFQFDGFLAKGYVHELVARFSEPANYALFYGNEKALRPRYDIDHFQNKIPAELTNLTLGKEQILKGERSEVATKPLFQSKIWLWFVMVVIIGLLGWFSLKMIRNG